MKWYDRDGHVIDMAHANDLLSNPGYKQVAYTEITSASNETIKFRVSTVWLGLDHSHGRGEPLIFETMVFSGDPDPAWVDQLCQRYTNELDAKLGHEETVVLVAATVPDEILTATP